MATKHIAAGPGLQAITLGDLSRGLQGLGQDLPHGCFTLQTPPARPHKIAPLQELSCLACLPAETCWQYQWWVVPGQSLQDPSPFSRRSKSQASRSIRHFGFSPSSKSRLPHYLPHKQDCWADRDGAKRHSDQELSTGQVHTGEESVAGWGST